MNLLKMAGMLKISADTVERAIDHGIGEQRLVQRETLTPSGSSLLIYLTSLDGAERSLDRNLLSLLRGTHPCPAIDIEKAIEWLQKRVGLSFADSQKAAIRTAMQSKVLVITGGPGVGKTNPLTAILKIFQAKKLNTKLP